MQSSYSSSGKKAVVIFSQKHYCHLDGYLQAHLSTLWKKVDYSSQLTHTSTTPMILFRLKDTILIREWGKLAPRDISINNADKREGALINISLLENAWLGAQTKPIKIT